MLPLVLTLAGIRILESELVPSNAALAIVSSVLPAANVTEASEF